MQKDGIPRSKKTERCGDLMPQIMQFLHCEKEYQKQCVFHFWEKIVGRDIAAHVRPARMDFRTLYLSADAPAWANQLRYMEGEIIERINAFACADLVREIRFGTPRREKRKAVPEEEPEADTAVGMPTAEEKALAEEKSSQIEDGAIREAAARALAQSYAKKRARKTKDWHGCAACGRLVPPRERYCAECERSRRESVAKGLRKLLWREPWLRPQELRQMTGCALEDAVSVRSALLREFSSYVEQGDEESEEARRLVMLFASVRPENLTREIVKNALRKLRFDVLYAETEMPKTEGKMSWQEAAAKRFANRRRKG